MCCKSINLLSHRILEKHIFDNKLSTVHKHINYHFPLPLLSPLPSYSPSRILVVLQQEQQQPQQYQHPPQQQQQPQQRWWGWSAARLLLPCLLRRHLCLRLLPITPLTLRQSPKEGETSRPIFSNIIIISYSKCITRWAEWFRIRRVGILGHSLVHSLVCLHHPLIHWLCPARFAHASRCDHLLTPELMGKRFLSWARDL